MFPTAIRNELDVDEVAVRRVQWQHCVRTRCLYPIEASRATSISDDKSARAVNPTRGVGGRAREAGVDVVDRAWLREFLHWPAGDAGSSGRRTRAGAAGILTRARAGPDIMFNFWVNQHLFSGLPTIDAWPLARALQQDAEAAAGGAWAHFLRNHDELRLRETSTLISKESRCGSGSRTCH